MAEGIMFGRFQLVKKLGQGGFGEVWLARDPQKQRDVALKVLHQGLMNDARFVSQAQKEAEIIGKISHPNIVKVYEVVDVGGRLCIVMEYIDGQPLSEMLKEGQPLTTDQALAVVEQVASALDATHAKKIIHRDVKPANILIDKQSNAHLVDFGLAKAARSTLGSSASSVGLGTAAYMSPEQAGGRTGDVTSDVYSLGVLAYEMLVGRLPFLETTFMGFMIAHREKEPPAPSKFNKMISQDVQRVLLKVLSKDPAKRYRTPGAFAKALRKASSRPFRSADRRAFPWALVLIGISVLALVVGVGGRAMGLWTLPGGLDQAVGRMLAMSRLPSPTPDDHGISPTGTPEPVVEATTEVPIVEEITVLDTVEPIIDTPTPTATTPSETPSSTKQTAKKIVASTLTPTLKPTQTPTPSTTPDTNLPTGTWAVRAYRIHDMSVVLVNGHIVGVGWEGGNLDWVTINDSFIADTPPTVAFISLNDFYDGSWGFSLRHNDVIVWGNEGDTSADWTIGYAQTLQLLSDNTVKEVGLSSSGKKPIGGTWTVKLIAEDAGVVLVNGVPVAAAWNDDNLNYWHDISGLLFAGQDNIVTVTIWNSADTYSWDVNLRKGDTIVWGSQNKGSGQTGEVFYVEFIIDGEGSVVN